MTQGDDNMRLHLLCLFTVRMTGIDMGKKVASGWPTLTDSFLGVGTLAPVMTAGQRQKRATA